MAYKWAVCSFSVSYSGAPYRVLYSTQAFGEPVTVPGQFALRQDLGGIHFSLPASASSDTSAVFLGFKVFNLFILI